MTRLAIVDVDLLPVVGSPPYGRRTVFGDGRVDEVQAESPLATLWPDELQSLPRVPNASWAVSVEHVAASKGLISLAAHRCRIRPLAEDIPDSLFHPLVGGYLLTTADCVLVEPAFGTTLAAIQVWEGLANYRGTRCKRIHSGIFDRNTLRYADGIFGFCAEVPLLSREVPRELFAVTQGSIAAAVTRAIERLWPLQRSFESALAQTVSGARATEWSLRLSGLKVEPMDQPSLTFL